MLSPFACFIEEIWEGFGLSDSIFNSSWPIYNEEATKRDSVEIAIQINNDKGT